MAHKWSSQLGCVISDIETLIQLSMVLFQTTENLVALKISNHFFAHDSAVWTGLIRVALHCHTLGLDHLRWPLQFCIGWAPLLGWLKQIRAGRHLSLSACLSMWLSWDLSYWCWVPRKSRPEGQAPLGKCLWNTTCFIPAKWDISKRDKPKVSVEGIIQDIKIRRWGSLGP